MGEVTIAIVLVLAVVTLLGHGIWVLIASLLRLISGAPPANKRRMPTADERPPGNARQTLIDLRARLVDSARRGAIDRPTAERLAAAIDHEAQSLRIAAEARKAAATVVDESIELSEVGDASLPGAPAVTPAAPIAPTSPTPAAPAPTTRERAQAYATSRAQSNAAESAAPPLEKETPPARRRGAFSDLLTAFMAEKNIRWGELVGGLLIIGSSIALVISFWAEIAGQPLLKFVLFNGVTAALFGVGLYTDRKWKIHTTSHGVLVIASLLVPLNFLAIAAFTQESPPTDFLSLAGEAISAVVFSWFIYLAARIIAPDAPALFTAGVMLPSLAQLVIRRWAGPALPLAGQFALAAAPIAANLACTTVPLRRYWKGAADAGALSESAAQRVFTFAGVLSAAMLLPLALLASKLPPIDDAIHRLSPVLVWCGVPAVLVGLLFWRHMTVRRLSGMQTAGLTVGVLGAAVIIGAMAMAWPDPSRLLPVALMVAAMFTWIALGFEISAAHLPAGLAIAAAWVIGFHLLRGELPWTLSDHEPVQRALFSLASGNVLIPLMGLFAGAAWLLQRFNRRADSQMLVCVAAVTGVLSAGLVLRFGFARPGDPGGAFWTLSTFGVSALVAAFWFNRSWVTWLAWALVLVAVVQGVVYRFGSIGGLEMPWVAALLSHATLALAACLAGRWKPSERSGFHAVALYAAAISTIAAAVLLGSVAFTIPARTAAIYLAWLAILFTSASAATRNGPLLAFSQVVVLSAIFAAVVAMLQSREWYAASARPWLDPWFLEAQGIAVAAYCAVSALILVGLKRINRPAAEEWPWAAAWSAVERVVAGAATVLLVVVALYAAVPGALQEMTPLMTARGTGPANRIVPPIEAFEIAGVPHAHAAAWGAWILLGCVAAALLAGLPSARRPQLRWQGLFITFAAACPLLAARWEADVAVASALRWITAGAFLVASVPVWIRWSPLPATSSRPQAYREARDLMLALLCLPYVAIGVYVVYAAFLRAGTASLVGRQLPEMAAIGSLIALIAIAIPRVASLLDKRRGAAASAEHPSWALTLRNLLLVMLAAPLGVLLAFAVAASLDQYPLVGPEPGSSFRTMGWDASYGIPLALIAFGLVGYAVRDRSSQLAFTAGVLGNIVATLAVTIRLVRGGGGLDASAWMLVAVVNAIVSGAVALLWCAAVEWWHRRVRASSDGTPPWPQLLQTQRVLAAVLCGLFLISSSFKLAIDPVRFAWASAAGGGAAWLAVALATAATLWLWRRAAVSQSGVAVLVAGMVSLAAATTTHWDTGNWLAYHVLLFGCCLAEWLTPPLAFALNRVLTAPADARPAPTWSSLDSRFFGIATVALALRALEANPLSPWAAMVALSITGARNVWIAWRETRGGPLWIAAMLFNFAASIWWLERGHSWTGTTGFGQLLEFVQFNVMAAMPTALLSAAFLARPWQSAQLEPTKGPRSPGFHRFAAWGGAITLFLIAAIGLAADVSGSPIYASQSLAWMSWLGILAIAVACWWDGRSRWPVACLYSIGLVGVGIYLDGLDFVTPMFQWALANSLAAYSLITAYLWSRRKEIAAALLRWRAPVAVAPGGDVPPVATFTCEGKGHTWLVSAGVLLAIAVLALVAWVEIVMERFSMRMIAAYAVGAEGLALGLLARGAVRTQLQYAALVFGALFALAFGWAFLSPDFPAPWLHRCVAAATALAVVSIVYGMGLAKLLRRENEWTRAAMRLVPELIVASTLLIFGVLAIEVVAFAKGDAVPVAWGARLAVLAALAIMTAAALAAALLPGRDPLGLSERGRTAYVYAAEGLLALAFIHVRVTMPWLFQGWFLRFWPLVIMAVAFVGVGVGEIFKRRQQKILGEPLESTGALLPLLPACGFWMVTSDVHYSLLLLSIGALYAGLAALRKSFMFAALSAVAINGSLWYLLYTREGLGIAEHPQLWLIPPALCALVAGFLNRERLSAEQSAALRYGSAIVIYASSTADIFINGVAEAPWLPAVLAAISIAGVFAGILLQVRAFLYLGTSFLLVAILTVIWHAAQQRTWVYWIAGIVSGVLIIALFGVFEKRRDDILRLVERLKQWEA